MGYWKSKVVPTFKKLFEKNGPKKAAAAEACKAFDDSKEGYSKEFEEKKSELQTKVVEIYEASSTEIKGLLKEPKEAGLKKHSAAVQKFLEELEKIEFPGSKPVSEASSKFGPVLVSGPVIFIFEKVSTFVVTEEPPAAAAPAGEETSGKEEIKEVKEKEIVVEPEKKEEAAPAPEPTPAPAAEVAEKITEPASVPGEPAKVEEPAASAAEPAKP